MSAVAVVGAGIAGLTVAFRLSAKHEVVVFEREAAAGGKIRSQHIDGFVFDWGPNGFLSSASELRALVHDVGLDSALTAASRAAKNRFIYWDGRLHKVPAKPPDVVRMSLLSTRGKARALGEFFIRAASGDFGPDEESVHAFMARRFGPEVAERLVSPAVLGISGGDAAQTSVAALFPRLRELEREHGSVLRGLLRGGGRGARLSSFGAAGMQRLTDRLAELQGSRLHLGTAVRRIEPQQRGWRIVHDRGEAQADAVILATPADVAATQVEGFDEPLAGLLRRIPYAAMRAIGVAFRTQDVATPLDGFGFLAGRGQGVRILGAVYTSTIYPDQAPAGTVYLRVFMGGATDPEAGTLDAGAVQAIVRADLAQTLGITAAPIAYHEIVWPQAIPQYTLRHQETVRKIAAISATYPMFGLAGNAYRGLGVGENVRAALAVAARLEQELAQWA